MAEPALRQHIADTLQRESIAGDDACILADAGLLLDAVMTEIEPTLAAKDAWIGYLTRRRDELAAELEAARGEATAPAIERDWLADVVKGHRWLTLNGQCSCGRRYRFSQHAGHVADTIIAGLTGKDTAQ